MSAPGFDITTPHGERCGVCMSDDVELNADRSGVDCIECGAVGVRCSARTWIWADGPTARAIEEAEAAEYAAAARREG